jgi:CRP-like cAMP-binding protein
VEERLARWLLMTHDRLAGDELNLTEQILSEMPGVRRASVTTAAGVLQRAGLIEYRRGRIRVLNRAGLEAAACACYGVQRECDRLLG